MIGTVYPSEKRTYTDEKSGAQITQLTLLNVFVK